VAPCTKVGATGKEQSANPKSKEREIRICVCGGKGSSVDQRQRVPARGKGSSREKQKRENVSFAQQESGWSSSKSAPVGGKGKKWTGSRNGEKTPWETH